MQQRESPYSRLMKVVERLKEVDRDMPLSQLSILLKVVEEGPITLPKLAEELELPQSTTSRSVSALGRWGTKRKRGRDLVYTDEDPEDRRRKRVGLTFKGHALMQQIARDLRGR